MLNFFVQNLTFYLPGFLNFYLLTFYLVGFLNFYLWGKTINFSSFYSSFSNIYSVIQTSAAPSWLGFWLRRSKFERKCGGKSASQWNGRSNRTRTGNGRVDRAKKDNTVKKRWKILSVSGWRQTQAHSRRNSKSVLVVALSLPKQIERPRKRQCPWHEWGRVSARDVSPWIREEDRKSDLQIHGQQA